MLKEAMSKFASTIYHTFATHALPRCGCQKSPAFDNTKQFTSILYQTPISRATDVVELPEKSLGEVNPCKEQKANRT
jgi:hypothetical protein